MFNYEISNQAYTHEAFKNDIPDSWQHHLDDGFIFPFNLDWKMIGVNLSGGADSAAGTATLCKLIQQTGSDCKITVLTNVRVWHARPWAGPISVEVYNKLCEMFPGIIVNRLQNFIPPRIEEGALRMRKNPKGIIKELGVSGDRICVDEFNRYSVRTNQLEAVYNFTTLNPTEVHHRGAPHDRRSDKLELSQWKYLPQVGKVYGDSYLIQPWTLVEKDFVISQYFKNSWEQLLDITRSCEGDKDLWPDRSFENGDTYVHGVSSMPTCLDVLQPGDDQQRVCFWCAEREWAERSAREKMK